jgi:tetratricopeptide (TPR) repeat protein
LPEDATGQELAGMVTFVDTVRSGDLSRAREAMEAGRGGGPFVDELSLGWMEFGAGNMDRAAAVFEDLTDDPALSDLAWLHLGLARAAVGDFEAAEDILSGERSGRMSQTERVVRARAEILVQLGRRADALDLLDGYTQRVPDPALLALQARIGAGAEGPYSFVTTWQEGISEVFFTVAQAFGPDRNGNLPLIYARAAYGISEKNTDALILAGEILTGDEQYDLAAETYGIVPETDDQYVEAQMGRAEALERQGIAGRRPVGAARSGDRRAGACPGPCGAGRYAAPCRAATRRSGATPKPSTASTRTSRATGSSSTPARFATT